MIGALGVDIARLYTLVFALGAALAGFAGALIGAIQSVQVGMGEPVLILAFVVIVIGGIGSVKGALVGSVAGRAHRHARPVPAADGLSVIMDPPARRRRAALASMSIYILMAAVLLIRPTGLYGEA
jgi:branched-chain amino acid transport system permease protein